MPACVFGRVAFVYCLSVCVQHKSKSSEQILTNFSEKVSNDKICNCTVIPCTLLIGYHLVPRYSESLAVPPPQFQFRGDGKTFFVPESPQQVSACTESAGYTSVVIHQSAESVKSSTHGDRPSSSSATYVVEKKFWGQILFV